MPLLQHFRDSSWSIRFVSQTKTAQVDSGSLCAGSQLLHITLSSAGCRGESVQPLSPGFPECIWQSQQRLCSQPDNGWHEAINQSCLIIPLCRFNWARINIDCVQCPFPMAFRWVWPTHLADIDSGSFDRSDYSRPLDLVLAPISNNSSEIWQTLLTTLEISESEIQGPSNLKRFHVTRSEFLEWAAILVSEPLEHTHNARRLASETASEGSWSDVLLKWSRGKSIFGHKQVPQKT